MAAIFILMLLAFFFSITECGELIAALDECHNRGLMARMTGACNDIKHELNMCLREEVSAATNI